MEVAILCATGAGYGLMACISRNIRAVGLCETNEHRKFVMQQLISYVRAQRLVNMSTAPAKAQELVEWERKMQTGPAKVATMGPAKLPTGSSAQQAAQQDAIPGVPVVMATATPAAKATPQTPGMAALATFGSVVL